jgi:hypothetical protein
MLDKDGLLAKCRRRSSVTLADGTTKKVTVKVGEESFRLFREGLELIKNFIKSQNK